MYNQQLTDVGNEHTYRITPASENSQKRVPWAKPLITEEEIQAVVEVMRSGWVSQGPKVHEFEQEFATYIDIKHAVAVSSGTAALHSALLSLDIGPGDEVIIPALTYPAAVNVVLATGARPVLADVDPRTFNMDPVEAEKKITRYTKAIMPINYGGMPCDVRFFLELADRHNIFLVEDAAEAVGAEYQGRKVGSMGHLTCFSFHAAKQLTTVEGGMIVTDDDDLAEKCRLIRSHGMKETYRTICFGMNYKMTDLQAAIGLVQLSRLSQILTHLEVLAKRYIELLNNAPLLFQHVPPYVTRHPWFLFPILLHERDEAIARLVESGVETRVCWPPIHMQPYHSKLFQGESYPCAELTARRVICLPIYNGMTFEEQDHVVWCLRRFFAR